MKTDLFSLTERPDPGLFHRRNDPNDRRMGERVSVDPDDYAAADVVILGCPEDEGVRRNRGRIGAAEAPAAIRRALYKFPVPEKLGARVVFDLGDIRLGESLEVTHERQKAVVKHLLNDGKEVVILGGGNDISYPDCAALAEVADEVLVFNVDSHYDVREDEIRHSGTPYRQLIEEEYIHPPRFYEIASKKIANSPAYEKYLRQKGVTIHSLHELRDIGIERLFEQILEKHRGDAIFWGFDLDSVRSMDAPGVSAGYPVGLTAEEICRIAELAGKDSRTRVVELTEVNPAYDLDNRTSKLAAMMILYYLNA